MSLRLGIIGAGGIGAVHAEAARRAGSTIAAVFDPARANADQLAAQHPGALRATSLDELLALRDVPAVVIAAPNAYHRDLAVAALRAGKDVLLEKPMGLSLRECDDIIAAMKESRRLVQLSFVSRESPTARAAHELIGGGALGTIYHVKAAMYRRRGIPGLGRWFTTKRLAGGGALIDLGVHLIDLALHLTGRPRPLRASGSCTCTFGNPIADYSYAEMWAGPPDLKGTCDVEDAATALIRFESGVTLELNVTWAANLAEGALQDGITLFGDRGGLSFDTWGSRIALTTEKVGKLIDAKPAIPPHSEPWSSAWQRQHELFAHAVETRTLPHATAAHGREVQAIVEAIYRSSEAGREVEIES